MTLLRKNPNNDIIAINDYPKTKKAMPPHRPFLSLMMKIRLLSCFHDPMIDKFICRLKTYQINPLCELAHIKRSELAHRIDGH